MFTQFEEVNLLSETCDNAESGDKYDGNSIIPPLISEEEMDTMDSGEDSDDEPMSTDMLEDICDGSKYHSIMNRRESRYKINDHIKQIKMEWKGALLSMRKMCTVLHQVFKAVVNDISQVYQFWVNLAYKFPILFQSPETFLK